MKSFFKNALMIILIVLLASTLFSSPEESHQASLSEDIYIVNSGGTVEGDNSTPIAVEDSNMFAKIGAGISELFYTIINFVTSTIVKIFIVKLSIA